MTNDTLSFQCNFTKNRVSNLLPFSFSFEGIPENLIVNILACFVLLCIFVLINKNSWNYERLALVIRGTDYEDPEEGRLLDEKSSLRKIRLHPIDSRNIKTKQFLYTALFRLNTKHVLKFCGIDAAQYLTFQQYIIIYLSVVCILSICVLLPINLNGNNIYSKEDSFSHTSLSNLSPKSLYLWVHIFISTLYFYLGLYLMILYKRGLEKHEENCKPPRKSIMIINIPLKCCCEKYLKRYFEVSFPKIKLDEMIVIYDDKQIKYLKKRKTKAIEAQLWCEAYNACNRKRLQMHTFECGILFNFITNNMVDALDFYEKEEATLAKLISAEERHPRPLGIVILTFKNEEMALKCFNALPNIKGAKIPNKKCILYPKSWKILFGIQPEDILWSNVSTNYTFWYIKIIFVNFCLIFIFIFFTTPVIIINNLSLINIDTATIVQTVKKVSTLVSELLPSLMMLIFTAILPLVVVHSNDIIKHWTRTNRNLAIMVKTYLYLLFMVLILPSLSLTSVSALKEVFFQAENQTLRWKCVFLPDNGAFFINYVITATFIGVSVELLRISDVVYLFFQSLFVRSKAELRSLAKLQVREFEFGIRYSWFLLIFTTVLTYSLSCPLITPFGLTYMILKHIVDRYNIFFVFAPSKINYTIHIIAMNFVLFSPIMAQISLFSFILLRGGFERITSHLIALIIVSSILMQIRFNFP